MGCVSSEEVIQQHSPSSSTSSLEMIELIETKEMIYKNNIKKLFKEENTKNNCYDIQLKWKTNLNKKM
jgi:hypothetical protein